MSSDYPARICIVSSSHISSNPRAVKEADALAEAGFQTSLVYTQSVDWLKEWDQKLESTRRWTGIPIDFTRTGSPIRFWKSRARHFASRVGPWRSLFAENAVGRVTSELTRAVCRRPSELYIAHNLAALPAAAKAASLHRARLGFDAEDFHSGDWPDDQEGRLHSKMARLMEQRYLPKCDYVTAASPGIADEYARVIGIQRPHVVRNVFPLSEAPSGEVSVNQPVKLYWFSQTIGPGRGLEIALVALSKMTAPAQLYLQGTPSPGYQQFLSNLASDLGVGSQVHFLKPVYPSELIRFASQFDIGLALEQRTCRNKEICESNKLYSYLLAGLPIAVSDLPGQSSAALEMGNVAEVFPSWDAEALANLLDLWAGARASLACLKQRARKVGFERFNWDVEKHQFLEVVRFVLLREHQPRDEACR